MAEKEVFAPFLILWISGFSSVMARTRFRSLLYIEPS
jgi:hypothetical protein